MDFVGNSCAQKINKAQTKQVNITNIRYFHRLWSYTHINRSVINCVLSLILSSFYFLAICTRFASILVPTGKIHGLYHTLFPTGGTTYQLLLHMPIPHSIGRGGAASFVVRYSAVYVDGTIVRIRPLLLRQSGTLSYVYNPSTHLHYYPPLSISEVSLVNSCAPFCPVSCSSARHPPINSGTNPRGGN